MLFGIICIDYKKDKFAYENGTGAYHFANFNKQLIRY